MKRIDKKKWFLKDGTICIGYPSYGTDIKKYTAQDSVDNYNKHKANNDLHQENAYADPIIMAKNDINTIYKNVDRKKFIKWCDDVLEHYQEALYVCDIYGIDKSGCYDKIKYFTEMKRLMSSKGKLTKEEYNIFYTW